MIGFLLLISIHFSAVSSFGSVEIVPQHLPLVQNTLSSIIGYADLTCTNCVAGSSLCMSSLHEGNPEMVRQVSLLSNSYQQALKTNPYETKMATGVVLAIIGDAIAQLREPTPYDVKRATAFAAFDAFYRGVQQLTYPLLIAQYKGQHILSLLVSLGLHPTSSSSFGSLMGPLEQTLVSQLVIIPTIYYPMFFTITGMIQGLTMTETIERARDTFPKLMKRNLLFWIPVQFTAFGYIQEDLQIPVLIVCGLLWTIILSASAGAIMQNMDSIEYDELPEVAMREIDNPLLAEVIDGREKEEIKVLDREL